MHLLAQISLEDLAQAQTPLPKSGCLAFFFSTDTGGGPQEPYFPGRVIYVDAAEDETPEPEDIGPVYGDDHSYYFKYASDRIPGPKQFLQAPIGFHTLDIAAGHTDAEIKEWLKENTNAGNMERVLFNLPRRGGKPWLGLSAQLWASDLHRRRSDLSFWRGFYQDRLERTAAQLKEQDTNGILGRLRALVSPPPPLKPYELRRLKEDNARADQFLQAYDRLGSAYDSALKECVDWAFNLDRLAPLSDNDLEVMKSKSTHLSADFRDLRVPLSGGYQLVDRYIGLDTALLLMTEGRFDALPEGYIERINDIPFGTGNGWSMWHQIGGSGINVQGAPERFRDSYMLIQFGSDMLMNWLWGDVGTVQVWITPEDIQSGHWERAEFTLEGH